MLVARNFLKISTAPERLTLSLRSPPGIPSCNSSHYKANNQAATPRAHLNRRSYVSACDGPNKGLSSRSDKDTHNLGENSTCKTVDLSSESKQEITTETRPTLLRASRVPSSRLGRLFHYGGLAAGIGWGTASEAFRRTTGSGQPDGSSMVLSEPNVRRLVDKLTKMRGAALKLGQFMSIQDAKLLPPQLEQIFVKVQSTADYMPFSQTAEVLRRELGKDWESRFHSFSKTPIAAASIGQVHEATVIEKPGEEPIKVAVKVQFPGVYESIKSDLSYLSILASSAAILPRGLFLSRTLEVLGAELKEECDYRREARCGIMMREHLKDDRRYKVPRVFETLSTGMVLTTDFMSGVALTDLKDWSDTLKDKIGHDILELCLKEVLQFKLMQTDPNWSNLLWNKATKQIELIDFGATREYSDEFVKDYLQLLYSGINEDREKCIEYSRKMGYLTGQESEEMKDSHYRTVTALGEPFRRTTAQPYDFSQQNITDRVRAEISTMIRLRLTPPPTETYSLNRKISGMFLLCSRLGSQIDCYNLLERLVRART